MAVQRPQAQTRKGIEKGQTMEGKKGSRKGESCRILITVTVPGSTGPIRFVARGEEVVAEVISTVLKSYAREGRLPILGSDLNDFVLHRTYGGSDALSPWEPIGCNGSRNFLLCKKQGLGGDERSVMAAKEVGMKGRRCSKKGKWKAWLNKSLMSFRISTC